MLLKLGVQEAACHKRMLHSGGPRGAQILSQEGDCVPLQSMLLIKVPGRLNWLKLGKRPIRKVGEAGTPVAAWRVQTQVRGCLAGPWWRGVSGFLLWVGGGRREAQA